MYLRKVGYDVLGCSDLTQEMDQRRALLNTTVNLRAPNVLVNT
jgi:hypothetical protein